MIVLAQGLWRRTAQARQCLEDGSLIKVETKSVNLAIKVVKERLLAGHALATSGMDAFLNHLWYPTWQHRRAVFFWKMQRPNGVGQHNRTNSFRVRNRELDATPASHGLSNQDNIRDAEVIKKRDEVIYVPLWICGPARWIEPSMSERDTREPVFEVWHLLPP